MRESEAYELLMTCLEQNRIIPGKEETLNNGDYYEDGLLYCGTCGSAKQCKVELLGQSKIFACLCECAAEAKKAEIDEQHAIALRRKREQFRRTGFPEADMKYRTFRKDDRNNQNLSQVAKNYADNFGLMLTKGKGLLLYGSVGTGKTFISACIANELIDKGYPCLMTSFPRLINEISGMSEGRQTYIDGLNHFDLLIIDDLASERDTEFANEIVQAIVDSRYRAGLPLIVTTNLTAEEIKNPAEIKRQRIYSRLLEMCIPYEVKGKDRRRAKAKEDYEMLNELLGLNGGEYE